MLEKDVLRAAIYQLRMLEKPAKREKIVKVYAYGLKLVMDGLYIKDALTLKVIVAFYVVINQ